MTDSTPFDAVRSTKLAAELRRPVPRPRQLVTLRDLKQGEILAAEGVVDNHLYVILKGRSA